MHNPVNIAIASALLIAIVVGSFYYVYATSPSLGIKGTEVTPNIAKAMSLPEARGILIFVVDPGSPADRAGLKGGDRIVTIDGRQVALGGDVIVAVDGNPIQGVDDAEKLLADSHVGDTVKFTIIRGSTTLDVSVVLGGGGS